MPFDHTRSTKSCKNLQILNLEFGIEAICSSEYLYLKFLATKSIGNMNVKKKLKVQDFLNQEWEYFGYPPVHGYPKFYNHVIVNSKNFGYFHYILIVCLKQLVLCKLFYNYTVGMVLLIIIGDINQFIAYCLIP